MKLRFDKRARQRQFKPGDKVLVLLPVPQNPLQAKFFGPYTIEKKLSDLNKLFTPLDGESRNNFVI